MLLAACRRTLRGPQRIGTRLAVPEVAPQRLIHLSDECCIVHLAQAQRLLLLLLLPPPLLDPDPCDARAPSLGSLTPLLHLRPSFRPSLTPP